ncbi:MAG: orotate phosphoribosyltransferase [Candidatus Baldrarchaeia archaeon]
MKNKEFQESFDKNYICRILYEISALKIGKFVLSSGKYSPYYIDLRVLPSFPEYFSRICDAYVMLIKSTFKENYDKIAGIPTMGLVIATLVSYKLKKPLIYVRKEAKDYGMRKQVEGILNEGEKVIIVDDLITTGGNILNAAKSIKKEGGIVVGAVVLLDREQGGRRILEKEGIPLYSILTISELLKEYLRNNWIEREDYRKIVQYLEKEHEY